MEYRQVTNLAVKENACSVKFTDRDKFLFVDREDGVVTAHLDFSFFLDREKVFGFGMGIGGRADLLYIEFQAKDGRIKVPVGVVENDRQAEEWVRTANLLYTRS